MNPPPKPVRVVIVGKTRMGGGACIGGMIQTTGQPVRLLPVGGFCHPPDTLFNIGEIWELRLRPRAHLDPPHMEDHDEWDAQRAGHVADISAFIRRCAQPRGGEITEAFDGCLRMRDSGSAYLPRSARLPGRSVEFWITPQPLFLVHDQFDAKPKYLTQTRRPVRIPYVGYDPPVRLLPAGTLLRLSLARWWINPQSREEGETCSLQLSGWFGLPPARAVEAPASPAVRKIRINEDDIPF